MAIDVGREVAALKRLTAARLRDRYAEVFGEAATTGNKTWLVRRIAWRLQALAEGDLSERAKTRASELARDADLRVIPPRETSVKPATAERPQVATGTVSRPTSVADDRLPPPGSLITRPYKGGVVQVKVLRDGFEYAGAVYPSLSAVAKVVTGSHCNGFLFFKLTKGTTR
jgi:hypothetical protein